MRPLHRPNFHVVREPSLFDRVKGDLLVIGASRGQFHCFDVISADGTRAERFVVIPRNGVVKNDGPGWRIVGVAPRQTVRLQWVSGSCAPSPTRLKAMAVFCPQVKHYLRRQRLKALWRKAMMFGWPP